MPSPNCVCVGSACGFASKSFELDQTVSRGPQVQEGLSGGQRIHACIWRDLQVWRVCETSV